MVSASRCGFSTGIAYKSIYDGALRCVVPSFFVSGVGAGVGPCVFGCWRALLSSLALFGGLPLDPDYAVPDTLRGVRKGGRMGGMESGV